MPNRIEIEVIGLDSIEAAIRDLGSGSVLNALLGPSLGAAAAPVRKRAKQPNFVFTDRKAPRRQAARYKSLRQSIRSRRNPAIYGGRRYKYGRAVVTAGGDGARQAFLVQEGHGGPRPARPYPFLRRALLQSTEEIAEAFNARMQQEWPKVAARVARSRSGLARQAINARTVARRARSR